MNMRSVIRLLALAACVACSGEVPDAAPRRSDIEPKQPDTEPNRADAAPQQSDTGSQQPHAVSGATLQGASAAVKPSGDLDGPAFYRAQLATIKAERDRPVHVVHETNPVAAGRRLMEQLSPSVSPDTPVLIKPNLGGFTWFRNGPDNGLIGRTTDPGFVEGIISWLVDSGVKKITVGESWGVDDPKQVQRLFRVSRYDQLAKKYPQVKLVDMNHYGGEGPDDELTRPVAVAMPEAVSLKKGLVLPHIYVEHLTGGLVINTPKLKTHQLATITAGIKNLMGVLGLEGKGYAHRNKWRMHSEIRPFVKRKDREFDPETRAGIRAAVESFSDRLLDAFVAAHPHMTLIDGVLAADGDGFDKTSSVPLGVAVGSYNTIHADVVAARMSGLWNRRDLADGWTGSAGPHHLERALERFYGEKSDQPIETRTDNTGDSPVLNFDLQAIGPFGLEGNAARVLSAGDSIEASYLGAAVETPKQLASTMDPSRTRWLMTNWKGERLPVGLATGVMCGYTDKEIVFVFRSRYRKISPGETPASNSDVPDLFKGDVVEVFLDPDPSTPQSYFELEASPTGARLDLSVDLKSKKFVDTWESGMTVISRVHESWNGWDAIIVVPLTTLGAPKPGDRWRINFYRTEGSGVDRQYMAWQPTKTEKPKFHVPASFGTLVFGSAAGR